MTRLLYCIIALFFHWTCVDLVNCGCLPPPDSPNEAVLCPRKCRCDELQPDELRVNCSYRGLSEIPTNLPYNTVELLLVGNELSRLVRLNLENCSQLVRLNVSFNRISYVDKDSLVTNRNLRYLDLCSNRLNITRIPPNTFDNLTRLTSLVMHWNVWNGSQQYNDRLLENLENLRELSLDAIPDVTFGSGFSRLKNLKSMRLFGCIRIIRNSTFSGFSESNVKVLSVRSSNCLYSLDPLAFSHFHQLEELDLSNNVQLSIERVSDGWWGLRWTKIKTLILTRIDRKCETILHKRFFHHLDATRIEKLVLTLNNINVAYTLFSSYLKNLTTLDMSYNKIGRMTYVRQAMKDLSQLPYLRHLNVAHQAYFQSATGGDQHSPECTEKGANCNYLSSPSKAYRSSLTDQPPLNLNIDLPGQIQVVNMADVASGRKAIQIGSVRFKNGASLRRLECQSNSIAEISGNITFTQNTSNLTMDLSNNELAYIWPDAFKTHLLSGGEITSLTLSGNRLGSQLRSDDVIFQHFATLKSLDLQGNNIGPQLPSTAFHGLISLEKLDLSSNNLTDLNFDVSQMTKLRRLLLVNNSIRSINDQALLQISTLMAEDGTGLQVDLTSNPLGCTCQQVKFVRWLHTHKTSISNFNENHCQGPLGTAVHIQDVYPDDLEFECQKRTSVIVVGTLFGLTLVLVSTSVCCYRYRWEFRYFFLKHTKRGKQFQLFIDLPRNYDYDAFVVYDSGDRDWVNEQLLTHLEEYQTTDGSPTDISMLPIIRLCVHERDFPPGEDILSNIWNKMEHSRKTILVLSKSFAKSHYCNYEVQLARMNSVEQARNVIIPVLLEPVDIKDMSECLSWIVRKLTYIEWPQFEADRHEFWQKLRDAVLDYDTELFTNFHNANIRRGVN